MSSPSMPGPLAWWWDVETVFLWEFTWQNFSFHVLTLSSLVISSLSCTTMILLQIHIIFTCGFVFISGPDACVNVVCACTMSISGPVLVLCSFLGSNNSSHEFQDTTTWNDINSLCEIHGQYDINVFELYSPLWLQRCDLRQNIMYDS